MRLTAYCNSIFLAMLIMLLPSYVALASDSEGCLLCHRYRGLGTVNEATGESQLFYVDPAYYERGLGPHSRLNCTDCHDREEVEIVPHAGTSPVDCTSSCHLDSIHNVEVRFGHNQINEMLEDSVHDHEVLARSNTLLGEPLESDQSQCLLCHEEPTYRRSAETWSRQEEPIGRCNVCHDAVLPVDARRYYWHVHARSQPANSNIEIIKNCGLCHSNDRIIKEFELSDSTATYLASFHGKSTLLGDEETAGCLDCHVGQIENVHQIKSYLQADSAASEENVADTCRNTNCHPRAGVNVGSASVHLQYSTSSGIIYIIVVGFVLLILFTFGPSMMFTLLDMLQIVVGRHDQADHENVRRAKKLMQDPKARKMLKRFTVFQRVQHWYLVLTSMILVCTGFPLKFAEKPLGAAFVNLLGGASAVRSIHRWTGILLLVGFLMHMLLYVGCYVIRQRKKTQQSWFRIIFNLPMLMSPSDFIKMGQHIAYLLFLRRRRVQWGRFSLEEKFEYFGVLWGTIILGVTGLLMWNESFVSRYLPGQTITICYIIHSFEAYLAFLHVGIVHLAHVLLAPAAFPYSKAMFTGDTPVEEMAEIHSEMLDEVGQKMISINNNDIGQDAKYD